ncbi:MAG: geranylgeranylglycerol-phosphate geranylgeranyltransferase [Candidatus Cloacimonetes bacterium]|nr:geranylgeranylglycerol-phosphate geranylgeranyltransferase [Candidatus Cloacimonadota bacterium]
MLMKIIAYLKIIRPLNCLFAMLTTFIGFWYLNNPQFSYQSFPIFQFPLSIIFACISTFLIAAGGYVVNDFFDFEIDKKNKPDRTLPKGLMSLLQAKKYCFFLFIIGFIFAFWTRNIYCIIIALVNSISLYCYARIFKKTFLLGNIIVAWNACSTFIYGALINSNIQNIMPIVCFSFIYTIMREWVKTIEDYEGDMIGNVRSIAVVLGKLNTARLLWLPAMILVANIYYFYHVNDFLWYALHLVITLPVFVMIIVLCKSKHMNQANLDNNNMKIVRITQKIMKLNMLLIVISFISNDIINLRF